jgi:hypothetical protein
MDTQVELYRFENYCIFYVRYDRKARNSFQGPEI